MSFIDLAALAIHDVKNRLALLASRAEAQGDRPAVLGLHEAAAELTRLLLVYKAEKGHLGAAIDAGVPAELVGDLVREVAGMTELTVETDIGAVPTLWFYDEHLVRMVLLNAVYNALRHARHKLSIGVRGDAAWLEFSVQDDGPGFPPACLGTVPAIGQLSQEGTGLGLYLAATVAELHRNGPAAGRIELANGPDGGAIFRLFLPK